MAENEINNCSLLTYAQNHANMNSTCTKVKVGSLIISSDYIAVRGCNRGIAIKCTESGCNRVNLYGENSKLHRLPSDCASIHSEIDAICAAGKRGIPLENSVIFVTRYPCEACARAICAAGMRKVVYGRKEKISQMTENMFKACNVEVIHVEDWDYEDDNR